MNTELSDLQKIQLQILTQFIRICDELKLRYYLTEGSMLGAQRHQGFIPWDDDIDIGMPRKDYEIFQKEAHNYLNSRYFLSNHRNNDEHYWQMMILFDKNNKVRLGNATEEVDTFAWIDIVPLDGMPNNAVRQWLHFCHCYFYRNIYQISHFSKIVNVKRSRPLIERIVIKIISILNAEKYIDSVKAGDKLHKILSKYDFDKSKYVMQILSAYNMKELMPREWFGKGTKYKFESLEVVGVDQPDNYLTQIYGDYMKLPPKEKQIGKHNAQIVYSEKA